MLTGHRCCMIRPHLCYMHGRICVHNENCTPSFSTFIVCNEVEVYSRHRFTPRNVNHNALLELTVILCKKIIVFHTYLHSAQNFKQLLPIQLMISPALAHIWKQSYYYRCLYEFQNINCDMIYGVILKSDSIL
jgi:hypothetical protein